MRVHHTWYGERSHRTADILRIDLKRCSLETLILYIAISGFCCGAYSEVNQDFSSKANSEAKGETDHFKEPFKLSMGYLRGRGDQTGQSYAISHGVTIDGTLMMYQGEWVKLSALLSYQGAYYTQYLTPSIEQIQSRSDTDTSSIGLGAQRVDFSRPSEVSDEYGHENHLSLGLKIEREQYTKEQKVIRASVGFGLKRSVHSRESLHLGELTLSSQRQDFWKTWGCGEISYGIIHLSASYGSAPCMGTREADIRLLIGGHFGRATLSLGWGSLAREHIKDLTMKSGPMAWLSMPLSAALYLQMSVWTVQNSKLSPLIQEPNSDGLSRHHFMVGLTWTGEELAPELSAEPNKSPSTPNHPPQIPQPNLSPPPLSPHLAPSHTVPSAPPL